jgi:hypothetical protein
MDARRFDDKWLSAVPQAQRAMRYDLSVEGSALDC